MKTQGGEDRRREASRGFPKAQPASLRSSKKMNVCCSASRGVVLCLSCSSQPIYPIILTLAQNEAQLLLSTHSEPTIDLQYLNISFKK